MSRFQYNLLYYLMVLLTGMKLAEGAWGWAGFWSIAAMVHVVVNRKAVAP